MFYGSPVEWAYDHPAHFKTPAATVRQRFPIAISTVTVSTHLTKAVHPLTVQRLKSIPCS